MSPRLSRSRRAPRILLSFDVEEFDVPLEYGQTLDPQTQLQVSVQGLDRLLELLDRLEIPATFFVTAHFAQHFPDRLKHMAEKHEIASHGFYHSQFQAKDLATSRWVLQKLTGQPIYGFRMARLQPVEDKAIIQAGYRYNTSLNPTYLPGRYNHFFKPRLPYRTQGLIQIPVSVTPLIRFPLFWLSFKNLPPWLYQAACRWALTTDRQLNLYFHPWEFAPIQDYGLPKYIGEPCGLKLLNRLETQLQWLKTQGVFVTFSEFLSSIP